jgi:S-adenosylmethionine decarboxylase
MHLSAKREEGRIRPVELKPKKYKRLKQCCPKPDNERRDHFVRRNETEFAGTHLILDLWGAKHLDDIDHMEKTMRECVDKAQATLLHIHLHHFTPNGGISGVAVLAESHISVHTWPERGFAAFDVFMCGTSRPEEVIAVLKKAFYPKSMKITENLRGVVADENIF